MAREKSPAAWRSKTALRRFQGIKAGNRAPSKPCCKCSTKRTRPSTTAACSIASKAGWPPRYDRHLSQQRNQHRPRRRLPRLLDSRGQDHAAHDRSQLRRHASQARPDLGQGRRDERHAVHAHPQHRPRDHRAGRLPHAASHRRRHSRAMLRRVHYCVTEQEILEIVGRMSPRSGVPRVGAAGGAARDRRQSLRADRAGRKGHDAELLPRPAHLSRQRGCHAQRSRNR